MAFQKVLECKFNGKHQSKEDCKTVTNTHPTSYAWNGKWKLVRKC